MPLRGTHNHENGVLSADDSVTGDYQLGMRFYGPMDARFVSPDPLSFAAGDMNLYRYVGNNAEDEIDPSGETYILANKDDIQRQIKYNESK
jgi:RHS repeat-associated protein